MSNIQIPAGEFGIDGGKMSFIDNTPVARAAAGMSQLAQVDAKLMRWFNLVAAAAALSFIGAIIVMIGVIIVGAGFGSVFYALWPFFLVVWAYFAVTNRNMMMVKIYGWFVFVLCCLQVFFFYDYAHLVVDCFDAAASIAKLPDKVHYDGPSAAQWYIFAVLVMINIVFAFVYWLLMIVSSIWAINMTAQGTSQSAIAPAGDKKNYGAV